MNQRYTKDRLATIENLEDVLATLSAESRPLEDMEKLLTAIQAECMELTPAVIASLTHALNAAIGENRLRAELARRLRRLA